MSDYKFSEKKNEEKRTKQSRGEKSNIEYSTWNVLRKDTEDHS
jgi:hypothetical protein